jgi:hypothetical protein
MYTTFCNCLCITVWHRYNKNNQTVVSIHTGFLTCCQKPGMDRNYCLIVVRNPIWIETTLWMFLLYIHLYVIQSISTVDNPRIRITNTEERQSIQKEKKSNHPQTPWNLNISSKPYRENPDRHIGASRKWVQNKE